MAFLYILQLIIVMGQVEAVTNTTPDQDEAPGLEVVEELPSDGNKVISNDRQDESREKDHETCQVGPGQAWRNGLTWYGWS